VEEMVNICSGCGRGLAEPKCTSCLGVVTYSTPTSQRRLNVTRILYLVGGLLLCSVIANISAFLHPRTVEKIVVKTTYTERVVEKLVPQPFIDPGTLEIKTPTKRGRWIFGSTVKEMLALNGPPETSDIYREISGTKERWDYKHNQAIRFYNGRVVYFASCGPTGDNTCKISESIKVWIP
jgi:hypothetical protein